ncbi:MAG: hypothetical protein HFJ80_07020 [Clostridiales bacterium]|nr:hypothetical protein [Clostridiales bacterium]
MTARRLMEQLFRLAAEEAEDTVDTCKAGDPDREVRKAALCCMATPRILRDAQSWGADLLITHEPLYYCIDAHDGLVREKRALVESTGMTIYRDHDHAHANRPDSIAQGILERLGWQQEDFDGRDILKLSSPRSARQLAEEMEQKLGFTHVRIAGAADLPVQTIALCLGASSRTPVLMRREDVELVVVGEFCEWQVGEYIRDAAELGHRKALLALGHVSSEKEGMRCVEQQVRAADPSIETRFFDNADLYSYTR